jgi:shikimate kinase
VGLNSYFPDGGGFNAMKRCGMVITLIGYRGCGKSTLAPRLAAALEWDWLDADVELERRAGITIREIFATEGEAGFRARERVLMRELMGRDRLVLAAGGGAVLNAQTRAEMKSAGPVVWLQASAETLFARISGDATTAERRPQLAGGGLQEVRDLLARRQPLYADCASLVCDVQTLTPDGLLGQLLPSLKEAIASRPAATAAGDQS